MDITIKKLDVPATSRNGRIYNDVISIYSNTNNSSISGGGDKNFTFVQGVPSAVWTIQHNLGKFPSVTVVDTAGTEVEGEVRHIDNNSLVLEFSAGFAGQASLN